MKYIILSIYDWHITPSKWKRLMKGGEKFYFYDYKKTTKRSIDTTMEKSAKSQRSGGNKKPV